MSAKDSGSLVSDGAMVLTGISRRTGTSEEVVIHSANESLLILVGWNDRDFLRRVQALLGLVLKRLGESIATCSVMSNVREVIKE